MSLKVVFDCNVFAQAILSPNGPAGQCLLLAQAGQVSLYVSEFVLQEISELHLKLPARAGVLVEDTDDLVQLVRSFAKMVHSVPVVFLHPIDPDDSAYVNLAIASEAELIVSRDRHLLGLIDPTKTWAIEFRMNFPKLRVLTPEQLLTEARTQNSG
jgi:putative PIN family toxin of toxin-antitoxin system